MRSIKKRGAEVFKFFACLRALLLLSNRCIFHFSDIRCIVVLVIWQIHCSFLLIIVHCFILDLETFFGTEFDCTGNPNRKTYNIGWFSGSSTFFLQPIPITIKKIDIYLLMEEAERLSDVNSISSKFLKFASSCSSSSARSFKCICRECRRSRFLTTFFWCANSGHIQDLLQPALWFSL